MKKLFFFFCFFLLILSSYALAEIIVLELKDPVTGKGIEDNLANVKIDGYEERLFIKNSRLELHLDKGQHVITISIDYPETEGKDYFGKIETSIEGNTEKVAYLTRTASLRGFVKDEFKNLIRNAKLNFECSESFIYPEKTDNVGFFSVPFVPTGSCRVFARYGNKAGSKKIELEHGKLYDDVEIILNKKVYTGDYYIKILIPLLVLIGAISYLMIRFWKERWQKQRMQAILSTLSEKERKIVEYLLKQKEASQTKICQDLEMPKTTVIRLLAGLENKKLATVEKLGRKYKKVRISCFFLKKRSLQKQPKGELD